MLSVLLIHPNPQFIKKSLQEFGPGDLGTSCTEEAKKWIHDESIPISAIYLYPNDSNFSSLEFLGETLKKRPVTPIYLFDEENELTRENLNGISKQFKVIGALKGAVTPEHLKNSASVNVPETLRNIRHRFYQVSVHEGYIAVPIIDFIYAKIHATPVFIEDDSHSLKLFATAGMIVDLQYLAMAASKVSWLYVPEAAVRNRVDSFEKASQAYLESGYLPISWKIAETLYRTRNVLRKLKKGSLDKHSVDQVHSVLGNLFQLTSEISQSVELDRLMAQAKRCDRSIFAVILSVLFCIQMKYSKGSMVTKTLGFASLLQDISLYETPYGDLSDANPEHLSGEAKQYYLNHPLKSAELLEKGGKVPEFALQVIRQQHERRDGTGYPRKIGGSKFQFVSEILSLINSYLNPNEAKDFYRHYSVKVVKPFLEVLKFIR